MTTQRQSASVEMLHHQTDRLNQFGITLVFCGNQGMVTSGMQRTGRLEKISRRHIFVPEKAAPEEINKRRGNVHATGTGISDSDSAV